MLCCCGVWDIATPIVEIQLYNLLPSTMWQHNGLYSRLNLWVNGIIVFRNTYMHYVFILEVLFRK